MRQIPNILSISRIILSILVFFLFEHKVVFITIYLIIGITDVLDGFIARKYKIESDLGAKLDSIGDLFFFVLLTGYLLIEQWTVIFIFKVPVLLIFTLRIINVIIGFIRHKRLTMIHTVMNKFTGFCVYFLPFTLIFERKEFVLVTIIIASIASIEELIIIMRGPEKKVDLNRKSIFTN